MVENGEIKIVRISCKKLVLLAYLYMVIPIAIFFMGWLKVYLSIPFVLLLLFALFYFIKKRYREDEYFYIDIKGLIIILFAIALWVYLSGIGGYFYQRSDWHARNAIFRDLINYSWPVIYPETGNALVYYYVFWLVPALVGKIFGWEVANFALYVWTFIGIFISMLLICKLLKLNTTKKVVIMIFVYILWSGLGIFGLAYADIKGYTASILTRSYGWADPFTQYQYTPNNALLEWVFNQSIVPWIAIPLFLQDKRIDVLAFLGLCVLPSAPFPFVGLFVLCVTWALPEIIGYIIRKEYKKIFELVFSIPNLVSIITIFVVFLSFFSCNTAASGNTVANINTGVNGGTSIGGLGWYIEPKNFTKAHFEVLIVFYILEFLIYSILLFKENKRNLLFYALNVSLLLCPLIRVGTSTDFCMRASIPALFVLMILVIEKLCNALDNVLTLNMIVLISVLAISSLSVIFDWGDAIDHIIATKRYPINADDTISLSNESAESAINFIKENPQTTFFYKYLAKGKSERSIERDLLVSVNFRKQYDMILSTGYYIVSPKQDNALCLETDGTNVFLERGDKTVLLSALKNGKNRLSFTEFQVALDVPQCVVDEKGTIWVWKLLTSSPAQKYVLEEIDSYYMICYEEYALTYDLDSNSVKLSAKTGADNQLWLLTK